MKQLLNKLHYLCLSHMTIWSRKPNEFGLQEEDDWPSVHLLFFSIPPSSKRSKWTGSVGATKITKGGQNFCFWLIDNDKLIKMVFKIVRCCPICLLTSEKCYKIDKITRWDSNSILHITKTNTDKTWQMKEESYKKLGPLVLTFVLSL